MAKVTAPLLSFSASGKIADTLVGFSWKGINVMRQYVVPSNPQTAAQTTQREAMSDSVSAWRNYFTLAAMRTAWNRLALELADTMSGFNAFIRNAVKVIVVDPDASFASLTEATAAQKVSITVLNLDDGAAGDEAGDFEIWVGDSPGSLLLSESVAIAASVVVGTKDLGDVGDIKYVKIRKGGYDRGGIDKITLIA